AAAEEDPIAKLTAKWSETDRAILKGLPEPAKELLLRRTREVDADHTRKTQQLAHERQQIAAFRQDYEPIAQIFAPHAEIMRQKGLTPHAIVQTWASVEQDLITKGPAAI